MARDRKNLQDELEELLGSKEVYFQPPTSKQLKYPCVFYKPARPQVHRADNMVYLYMNCYELMVVSKDPLFTLPETLVKTYMYCELNRFYTFDNLNYWSLTLYY